MNAVSRVATMQASTATTSFQWRLMTVVNSLVCWIYIGVFCCVRPRDFKPVSDNVVVQ